MNNSHVLPTVYATRTGHSNFAVTYAGMYRYLGTDTEAQKHIKQFGSGMMLIYRTEKVGLVIYAICRYT